MKPQLISYCHFTLWANRLILDYIEKNVSDDKIQQELVSSFPSLQKTLFHIWDAEQIWLQRLQGVQLSSWPSKSFNGTFTEAKKQMLETSSNWIALIERLSEQELEEKFQFKTMDGTEFNQPRWEAIHHCHTHSTFHRGQVITLLRQLGFSDLPGTDFIRYCRTQSAN
ncbi:MAG: DinB family protein [Bacteroidetes bacterium]|nr:DinB family protein [Bacteroidota bacterium]